MQNTHRFLLVAAWAAQAVFATSAQAEPSAFAVAVTLHTTMSKPLAVAQLCSHETKPIDMVGATIRIDCPVVAGVAEATEPSGSRVSLRRPPPEVVVTF